MPVTLQIDSLDKLEALLAVPAETVLGGVKVMGEVNCIKAQVWEWGSVTIKEPGPKTLWSTNPAGNPAILTITAPLGFIRVNKLRYLEILNDEFKRANFAGHPMSQWKDIARHVLGYAAERCANLMRDTAPIDTGDLRANIVVVKPDDALLTDGTPDIYGELNEFDLGGNSFI